nr:zinc finger protein 572-like isoform X2 [Lytechinus pictus]
MDVKQETGGCEYLLGTEGEGKCADVSYEQEQDEIESEEDKRLSPMIECSEEKSYRCLQCSKTFMDESTLILHLKACFREEGSVSSLRTKLDMSFKCPHCDKNFESQDHLMTIVSTTH